MLSVGGGHPGPPETGLPATELLSAPPQCGQFGQCVQLGQPSQLNELRQLGQHSHISQLSTQQNQLRP